MVVVNIINVVIIIIHNQMLYLPRGGIPPGACGIPLGAKLDK
jgi:hypothetical protein